MSTFLALAAFAALSLYAVDQFRRVNRELDPEKRLRLVEEANRERGGDWARHRDKK